MNSKELEAIIEELRLQASRWFNNATILLLEKLIAQAQQK